MAMDHARDGGCNIENAQEITDALEAQKTLGAINVAMDLGERRLEPKKGKGPKAYTGIDAMYDREYEYDEAGRFTGLRLRQFFCLGEGRFVPAAALRGLWRGSEFDAAKANPTVLLPTGGASTSEAKPKLSHEHNLKHFQVKRARKRKREEAAAAEAEVAIAEELQRMEERTTYACSHTSLGCHHRAFLSPLGMLSHSKVCGYGPGAKRPAYECCVGVQVRPLPLRQGSAFWRPLPSGGVSITLKVNRALRPSKPYGLQPHSALVHHTTPTAQKHAAETGAVKQVTLSLVLRISADNASGPPTCVIGASLTTHAVRPPPALPSAGWAIRPPQERARYTAEQKAYLIELYNWPLGRLNESQAYGLFKRKFNHPKPHAYQRSLRLSRAQIKAWFSGEKARQLKGVMRQAAAQVDQDEEEATDDAAVADAGIDSVATGAPRPSVRSGAPKPLSVKEMRKQMKAMGYAAETKGGNGKNLAVKATHDAYAAAMKAGPKAAEVAAPSASGVDNASDGDESEVGESEGEESEGEEICQVDEVRAMRWVAGKRGTHKEG